MATTIVTPVQLATNVFSDTVPVASGEAIVPADTIEIPYPVDGKLVVQVNNTTVSAKKVTVKAGSSEFVASVQGDLEQSLAAADVRLIVPSSDRFKQSNGTVHLTFEAAMTGFVQAFQMPY